MISLYSYLFVEYKATRKKHNGPSSTHFCKKNRNCFCYICSKFEV